MKLEIEPLTSAAFKPYGDVIETHEAVQQSINAGTTTRFHDLADLQFGHGTKPLVSIFRGCAFKLPFQLRVMERHPLASQLFYPLGGSSFLAVVAKDDDGKPINLRAFLAAPNQGVNYHANIWHHPLICLDKGQDFFVVDLGNIEGNLEEHEVNKAIFVET